MRLTHYKTGEGVEVEVDGNFSTEPANESTERFYAPAFIDLQVNGYGGVDFSNAETLGEKGVLKVVKALQAQGVAYFFPTLVTGSFEATRRSLELIGACCSPEVARSVVGVHLEGPYISPEDGPRGAHPVQHVRPPDLEEFDAWQQAAGGRVKLVTLAPEVPGALAFIEALRDRDILVALGHTGATPQQIRDAVTAGATLSTHLGNGAHLTLPRHPNYLWSQLAEDDLYACLIADGHHLPPEVLKVMVRAKGLDKTILVSDVTSLAGLEPGRYTFAGSPVELTTSGRINLSGTGYLAGSTLRLPDAVHNAITFADIPFAAAVEMASLVPQRALSSAIKLETFSSETFSVLERTDQGVRVVALVMQGDTLYQRAPSS